MVQASEIICDIADALGNLVLYWKKNSMHTFYYKCLGLAFFSHIPDFQISMLVFIDENTV